MTDRLDALIIDQSDLARDELAEALEGRVRFTKEGDLILEDAFEGLTTTRKVACLLLACRAANLLGLRESAGASPSELISMSGMAPGSVRPKLSALTKDRLIAKQGKIYVVPVHAGRKVVAMLGADGRHD